jgi:hypothetical protein
MLKRRAALAALCLVGAAVAPAGAAATKPMTRSFSASFTYAMLSSGSGLGVVHDRDLGKGMLVIAGPDAARTVTTCYPDGCITAQYKLAATAPADHSLTPRGTVTITSGSGTFRGAKGAGTFTGTRVADGTGSGRATGKITY